jgi:hypothetical protein
MLLCGYIIYVFSSLEEEGLLVEESFVENPSRKAGGMVMRS